MPIYRDKFGPYEPELARQTFKKLQDDKLFHLPIAPCSLNDWSTDATRDFRTLFWSSDAVADRVYAIYWNASSGVHSSSYPKNFYGFVRYLKEEKPTRAERKPKRRNKKRRRQQEQKDLWYKFLFE